MSKLQSWIFATAMAFGAGTMAWAGPIPPDWDDDVAPLASQVQQATPREPGDPQPPKISAITILTPTLNVNRPPAEIQLAVTFTSPDSGLTDISVELRSPSGAQHAALALATPLTPHKGTVEIGNGHPLSLYAEPGLWTVTQVEAGNYEATGHLTKAQIAAVLTGPGVMVVNHGPADVTKPQTSAARVLTPVISRSYDTGDGELKIALDASDDLSGIRSLHVLAHTGDDPRYGYAELTNDHPSLMLKGEYGVSLFAPEASTGAYTVIVVRICDNAHNCLRLTDPAAIFTLFGGNPAFTIAP